MNILIVEDEDMAAKKLTKTVACVDPTATVVAVTSSVRETVNWLRTHGANQALRPDLILMDIELADGQSFQIFEQIVVDIPIIFTTSYDEYAIKAFKVNSIDYLLKPIQKDELQAALGKLNSRQPNQPDAQSSLLVGNLLKELQKQLMPKEYRHRFLVQYASKLMSIETNQIAYFFTDNRLNQIRLTDGKKMIVDYTLDELEHMLDPNKFFRVSRSFLVSIASVGQVQTYFGNRLLLKFNPTSDKEVIISREKLTPFKDWLGK